VGGGFASLFLRSFDMRHDELDCHLVAAERSGFAAGHSQFVAGNRRLMAKTFVYTAKIRVL